MIRPIEPKTQGDQPSVDLLVEFFRQVTQLPIYSHGWLLFSILAIIPAIVSGNLVQDDVSKLLTGKTSFARCAKPLLLNLLILIVSISVAFYGFFLR